MPKTNAAGIALIKSFENCELTSYQDAVGVWTIGWGHTGPDVGPNQTITQARADALLAADLATAESAVSRHVEITLNPNQFSALVSFVYNVGETQFADSTLLRLINANELALAADQFARWVNSPPLLGLVRRRAAEKALFLLPYVHPAVFAAKRLVQSLHFPPAVTVAGGTLAAATTVASMTTSSPHVHAAAVTIAAISSAVAVLGHSPINSPSPAAAVPPTPIQLQKEPQTTMSAIDWKAIAGPLADAGVAYFEANEAALAPMIASGEASLETRFAAFLAKVFVSKNPLLGGLESELAKAFESQATALIAQYGAPAALLAIVDKELHYAATALGG